MKKILFTCLILFLSFAGSYSLADSAALGEVEDRDLNYYSEMKDSGLNFLYKFQTCTRAKNHDTKEVIYGRTKDGKCHYSYQITYRNEPIVYHCVVPLRTAIGYATTAIDVNEYATANPDLAQERLTQNNTIRRIMQDYCKMKMK